MTQAQALAVLKTGANVFLTGEPGSGKTHTVNQYVAHLRSCGVEPAITASTGIAATHIGGMTIHSWSGIGVRRDLSAYELDRIAQNRNVVLRVQEARTLIIDEVSMLSARTLAMVEAVCREVRRSAQPFGGLQVILVGDFFQLPPVSRRSEREEEQKTLTHDEQPQTQEEFAWRSRAWGALDPLVCYLSEQHRQEDAAFLEFLTALRRAEVGEQHKQLLRTRYARQAKSGATQLYSHNADVDELNAQALAGLPGEAHEFAMVSRGAEGLVAGLKRGCLSPERLLLKVGARVMFTKNDVARKRYANGTLGTVVEFSKENGCPLVKTNAGALIVAEPDEWRVEDGGRVLARITQIPLRLAWAMTVHKSQGMSLDAAHMDLSDTFEYGQGYVALSRVRSLRGLSLAGLNQRALEVHPEVLEQDTTFRTQSEAARKTFAEMPGAELAEMHANFIRACGGTPGAGRKVAAKKPKVSTYDATLALALQKLPLAEIAKKRDMTVGTIVGHLEKLVAEKKLDPKRDLAHIEKPKGFAQMKAALETVYKKDKKMPLSPARALLKHRFTYDELRLARLFLNANR